MPHAAIAPGEVAVVTGAALGIGRALAARLSAEGMIVVLCDIDAQQLHDARAAIPGETEAMLCDVAEIESLETVRDRIVSTYGRPPSVVGKGMVAPLEEWRRALDVNLMGVVNGCRAFMPAMIDARRSGMIVNVGSKQGITNPPGHPVYNMAKAAVRTFTEQVAHELRQTEGCQVTAHLLVPGWTATGTASEKPPGAWTPDQVADAMLDATAKGDFYIICPDNEVTSSQDKARIQWAAEDLTQNRPALSRWDPEWADKFKRIDK